MARIKFLDVLEETKSRTTQPQAIFRENENTHEKITKKSHNSGRDFSAYQDRFPSRERKEELLRSERISERINKETPSLRRDRSPEFAYNNGTRDTQRLSNIGYHNRRNISEPQKPNSLFNGDDHKVLWTGALFVFFGGMLFLSGYWLGKTVTGRVKAEGLIALNSAAKEYRREELNNTLNISNLPVIAQPIATTVDDTSQSIKIVEPAEITPKKTVKKAPKITIPKKEYVIQVSAHSSMASARLVEDKLRDAGYAAYTSESVVGDAVYFRVRIRGFTSKSAANKILSGIKTLGIGLDGYILSLD